LHHHFPIIFPSLSHHFSGKDWFIIIFPSFFPTKNGDFLLGDPINPERHLDRVRVVFQHRSLRALLQVDGEELGEKLSKTVVINRGWGRTWLVNVPFW